MPLKNSFIDGFQKDHSELLKLAASFHKAIESSNLKQAKEILLRIENITNGHFEFEETYLYPRLRRLVSEMTGKLCHEQQAIEDFIKKSRSILDNGELSQNESAHLLSMLPRLSKFFKGCNELAFLADKFSESDKEDLDRRFKDCSTARSVVTIKT